MKRITSIVNITDQKVVSHIFETTIEYIMLKTKYGLSHAIIQDSNSTEIDIPNIKECYIELNENNIKLLPEEEQKFIHQGGLLKYPISIIIDNQENLKSLLICALQDNIHYISSVLKTEVDFDKELIKNCEGVTFRFLNKKNKLTIIGSNNINEQQPKQFYDSLKQNIAFTNDELEYMESIITDDVLYSKHNTYITYYTIMNKKYIGIPKNI